MSTTRVALPPALWWAVRQASRAERALEQQAGVTRFQPTSSEPQASQRFRVLTKQFEKMSATSASLLPTNPPMFEPITRYVQFEKYLPQPRRPTWSLYGSLDDTDLVSWEEATLHNMLSGVLERTLSVEGTTSSSSWDSIRQKVRQLRDLPVNWDSYSADPIPGHTIENTLKLIDNICALGGEPQWVEPTSDGTISLQSFVRQFTVRFEVDDSEMVGIAIKDPRSGPVYRDVLLSDVGACLVPNRV